MKDDRHCSFTSKTPQHGGFSTIFLCVLNLFPFIFKKRYSPRNLLDCLELLDFTYFFASNFFSSPVTKLLLIYLFIYDFLLLAFSSSSSSPLTFVLLFLFASLSSSQLMTTNTQMVSLSLSLCHLSPPCFTLQIPLSGPITQIPTHPSSVRHSSHVQTLVPAVDTPTLGFCVVTRLFLEPCSCVQLLMQ